MKIRLLLFAVLRDIVGRSETELEAPAGSRASDIWNRLRTEFPQLAPYTTAPMTAINETYMPAETELHDGDEVAFIPPVSGGD